MIDQVTLKSVLLLILFPVITGCADSKTESRELIKISAASSLTDALEEIFDEYGKKTGVGFQLNLASSSTCARQIKQGMETDIFLSADQKWMDFLDGFYTEDSRRTILKNSLVAVIPVNSVYKPESSDDLLSENISRIAMGDPSHVPAGIYGKEALENAGIWEHLKSKIVGSLDVRAALGLAASGAVDCAIVYRSDVLIEKNVEVAFSFPSLYTPEIRYAGALFSSSPESKRFYDYLLSTEAGDIFSRYGFAPYSESEESRD